MKGIPNINERDFWDSTSYYYSDTPIINASGIQTISFVGMSYKIKEMMNSIDIASILIGGEKSLGIMVINRSCSLNTKWKIFNQRSIYLEREMKVEAPTFIWSFEHARDGKRRRDHFIMTCGDDFTLKFPVIRVTATYKGSFRKATVESEINSEDRFLDHLQNLLQDL